MVRGKRGLSSLELSLAAAACMTADHAAVALAAQSPLYLAFRAVGRVSFVIFAFLIAHSAGKTSSEARFCGRLLAFAVISEPVFDVVFYGAPVYMGHQNVFFTLLAGVLSAAAIKRLGNIGLAAAAVIAALAQLAGFDHGGAGVLLITAFYAAGGAHRWALAAAFAAASWRAADGTGLFSVMAAPLIGAYNGERGGLAFPRLRKWFFYVYYPAHIAVIGAVMSMLKPRF